MTKQLFVPCFSKFKTIPQKYDFCSFRNLIHNLILLWKFYKSFLCQWVHTRGWRCQGDRRRLGLKPVQSERRKSPESRSSGGGWGGSSFPTVSARPRRPFPFRVLCVCVCVEAFIYQFCVLSVRPTIFFFILPYSWIPKRFFQMT